MGQWGRCLTDRSLRLVRVAVLLLAHLQKMVSFSDPIDCIVGQEEGVALSTGSSHTSTHWRNSGSLSPTEAWTPAQNSSTQMARARKSGRGRILPAPVVVMISSFNPQQSKMAQGYRREEQRRRCMKRTDSMQTG